jgi:hypothetical protein
MQATIDKTVLGALIAVLLAMSPTASIAEDTNTGDVIETTEVNHAKANKTKHATLRFLKDNRVFLRARLDMLQLQTKRELSRDASLLDARMLRLQELADAIAAARDSVSTESDIAARRDFLDSVTELGDIEAQLSLMETILADQQYRLLMLEEDFLGHQETAMVILLKGLSTRDVPSTVALTEGNNTIKVELTPEQRMSLQQGGIAMIYHEYVEPREHLLEVRFAGEGWAESIPVPVSVETARDQLTFLELDLSELARGQKAHGLLTAVWYR